MKLGMIDYYLDEYHANHYPEWLEHATGERNELFAWAETQRPEGQGTDAWCAQHGARRCESPEKVCEKSDAILLLAPDDPEKHLPYARRVLPFGKPVFIDKTFAPDLQTAREIFTLAERCGTPVFSASSLRFSTEWEGLAGQASYVMALGGGSEFEVELIHPIEICAHLMGPGANRLLLEGDARRVTGLLRYADGRSAAFLFDVGCADLPYAAAVHTPAGHSFRPVKSDFFQLLCNAMIPFFRTGVPPVSREDTLEGIRIRDGVLRALAEARTGEWISL